MKRDNKISQKLGFTLVELLIVVIVIAVLAAIVIPKFSNAANDAKQSALKADIKQINGALDRFYNDTGVWPASLNDLTVRTAPAKGINKQGFTAGYDLASWHGPYLETVPTCPDSNQAFVYPAPSGGVVLTAPASSVSVSVSGGPDGG